MKKYRLLSLLLLLSFFCKAQNNPQNVSILNKELNKISVYTTASNTEFRLSPTDTLVFSKAEQPLEGEISIFVDPEHTFQTLMGIGGAITDASAEVFATLSKSKQQEFLDAYFDTEKGIGYTLLRTTIHSSDFSSKSYTYIEEGDTDLKTFSIEHDKKFRIPLIKKAMAAVGEEVLLYASPWSPPAFMKSNGNMLEGGTLLPQYEASWALYYTKFIKAYEKEGMPIWGITIQNEPMAKQRWESCIYTAEAERDFLKYHLGPTMEKEGLGDKKIVVWDHNRDLINNRANTIFNDPEASKYAWGIGFHWYETWAGGDPMHENVKKVNESFPTKNIIFTEGTVEGFDADKYYYWPNAERYGSSIINDFNRGTVAWTDWNILLDENGGPNHVENFCFAPVHADIRSGELIFTPTYYYLGHFSKFIRPGAKRMSTAVSRSVLLSTSFVNESGKMVTVVMNKTDDEIEYNFLVGNKAAKLVIPAHAMQSLVY
jgi:glucosylceramidase